jgi:hypothetical protein
MHVEFRQDDKQRNIPDCGTYARPPTGSGRPSGLSVALPRRRPACHLMPGGRQHPPRLRRVHPRRSAYECGTPVRSGSAEGEPLRRFWRRYRLGSVSR